MDDLRRVYHQEEGLLVPRDRRRLWIGVAVGVIVPVAVTPVATLHVFNQLPGVPYVLAVVLAAILGRLAAGIVAVLTSVTLIDLFVIAPGGTSARSLEDLLAVSMFVVVALIVAQLTARLERARMDAQHERERLTLLTEAGDTLGSSLDYATTIRELGHYLVPTFADWCSVDLVGSDGTIENLVVAHRDPGKAAEARELQRRYPPDPDAATGVPGVVRSGRPEMVPEVTDEMLGAAISDPAQLDAIRRLGIRSVMIVPLTANDRTFGAITFVGAESGLRYSANDLGFAQEIAHRAALAIANARAYRAEEQAKAEAEDAAARTAILQDVTAALGRLVRGRRWHKRS